MEAEKVRRAEPEEAAAVEVEEPLEGLEPADRGKTVEDGLPTIRAGQVVAEPARSEEINPLARSEE
jgi:hypothetical protein